MKSNRKDLEVVNFERERSKSYELDEELEQDPDVTGDAEKTDKAPTPDPIRNETVRIMSDLINYTNIGSTAAAKSQSP